MELGIRALHPDISPHNHQINSDFNACNMPTFQSIPPHVVQPDAGLQQFIANRQHQQQQQQQTQPLPVTTPTLPPLPAATQGQVMTDEQLETLRRQISVYATICQQLVEMHKAIMAQQNSASALWWGHATAFDASFHGMAHKLTSRQRWTPSQTQLQILERLFEQESGTPSKQRIKEITLELSQHGQISETNVYNWFQNRRARTKRKQQLGGSNNGESEPDTDADSPVEKKGKLEQDDTNHVASASQSQQQFGQHNIVLETSRQMQLEVGDSSISCSRGMINENGTSEHAHLVDQKVWDIHLPMSQNRTDVRQSQEMQAGLMMINPVESYH